MNTSDISSRFVSPRLPLSLQAILIAGIIASVCVIAPRSQLLAATPVTVVVVKTGDRAPDGDGVFDRINAFTPPVLNNRGLAGFRGKLAQFARGYGLFLGDAAGLKQIARTSDTAPGGKFFTLSAPAANDAGQLLFNSKPIANSNVFDLIRSGPLPNVFALLLAHGQAAPSGGGNISLANINQISLLNQSGHAAFVGKLPNSSLDSAIYRTSMAGTLVQIVRDGQSPPEGNGTFGEIPNALTQHPVINESGQVVFRADLTGTTGGSADNSGVYRGSGTTLTKIARTNDSIPGAETLVQFGSDTAPDMNDLGEVVVPFSLDIGSGQEAIFKGSGGPLTQIALQGETIPDRTETFASFNGFARINNLGQVAFISSVTRVPNPMNQTP